MPRISTRLTDLAGEVRSVADIIDDCVDGFPGTVDKLSVHTRR